MKRLNYFHTRLKVVPININEYLSRIGIVREMPGLDYLKRLHRQHLLSIPFENLDIHYGQKIDLNYAKILKKVIKRRRGGFCYELNGLFYHLLYHLGFDCHVISCRVKKKGSDGYGAEFDHMAIVVNLKGEQWLADVGFGDGFTLPKKIKLGLVQIDYTKYWKMEADPDQNFILKCSSDNSYYQSQYLFNTSERQLIEFFEMLNYNQTSRDSSFTQNKLITQLTNEGRITLTNRKLKIVSRGQTNEMSIHKEDEFLTKLQHHFNISFRQLIPRRN